MLLRALFQLFLSSSVTFHDKSCTVLGTLSSATRLAFVGVHDASTCHPNMHVRDAQRSSTVGAWHTDAGHAVPSWGDDVTIVHCVRAWTNIEAPQKTNDATRCALAGFLATRPTRDAHRIEGAD